MGKLLPLAYLAGMGLAFVEPVVAYLIYAALAALWLVPDRRIEAALEPGGAY